MINLRGPEAEEEAHSLDQLMIPFAPNHLPAKGITHAPTDAARIDPRTGDVLLQAIAQARGWMHSILASTTSYIGQIAASEGLAERHVRRLSVLAFLSPKIVQAIADGTAPADLTVSRLTQALPHAWAAQERMLGPGCFTKTAPDYVFRLKTAVGFGQAPNSFHVL